MRLSLLLFSSLIFFQAYGQYPATGNKQRLGYQTTGDGLVYRGNGSPAYTPSGINSAWAYIDTTAGTIYTYYAGSWHLMSAGGSSFDGHVDSLVFNSAVTVVDSVGKMYYDAANETISVGIDGGAVYQLGQELYYPLVINKSGATIHNGQPVMVDTATLVTGDHVRIIPARNGAAYPSDYVMGVATTDIPNDSTGLVTWFGYVREVKQADIAQTGITLNAGDILYISATEPGKYTNVRPSSPAHQSTVALVVRKPSVNNITLLVRPWLAPKLDNLSNVNVTSVTGLSVLRYNSVTGTWDASATPGIVAADTASMLSYYQKKLTNPVTGTGTAGQVAYWSGTATQTGNNNLFYDATNARLGVGTNAPSRNLQINGAGLPALHITNTTSGATSTDGIVLGIVDSNVVLNNFEPGYINFGTSDTSRMLIFRNGNINIGSGLFADYGYKLYVDGKLKSTNTIEATSFAANTNTPQRTIHGNASTGLAGLILTNNTSGATSTDGTQLYTDGTNTAFGNFENGYLAFLTNTTERMRITSGGLFGVLKNNPSYTLDINATDAIRIPSGTTVQRPTGAAGVMRYNSDSLRLEYHTGASWKGIAKTEELPASVSGFPRAAPVAVILSTYTVGTTDAWIICDYAGTVTLTLPSAASYPGREIMVKTIRAQSVVSSSSNVAPIDSNTAGTAILAATAGKWATLVSTGSQWIIMQSN